MNKKLVILFLILGLVLAGVVAAIVLGSDSPSDPSLSATGNSSAQESTAPSQQATQPTAVPTDTAPSQQATHPTAVPTDTAPSQESTAPSTEEHTHTYDGGTVTTQPACGQAGVKTYRCTVCGKTVTEAIAALMHRYATDGETAAACETAGSVTYRCSLCGHSYSEGRQALGHSYQSQITTAPGCETPGTNTFTCSRCGDSYTESVSAVGHSWQDATCTQPGTCSACGATTGSALGHADNGSGSCSHCGETLSVDMTGLVSAPLNTSNSWRDGDSFAFYIASDGWLDIRWYAKNNSGKTIKYYTVTAEVYNTVGDLICEETSEQRAGPIAPGGTFGIWAHIFSMRTHFNSTGEVKITAIKLEFTDGTTAYGSYGYSTSKQVNGLTSSDTF